MPCPLGAKRQILANNFSATLCRPEALSPDESGLGKAGALRHIMAGGSPPGRDGHCGRSGCGGTSGHMRRASRNWLGR